MKFVVCETHRSVSIIRHQTCVYNVHLWWSKYEVCPKSIGRQQAEIRMSLKKCAVWSWKTIREIANNIGISNGSAHAILTDDLGMRRVATKFVPKLLSCEQKELHLDVAQDMLECTNSDLDFLKTVITSDESWVYG
jgi:hypothetical protein